MIAWSAPKFEAQSAPAEAFELVGRALERSPNSRRLLSMAARIRLDQYDYTAAEPWLARLVSLDRSDATSWLLLASCRLELGRPEAALEALAASPAGPHPGELRFLRGKALAALGQVGEAECELRLALDIDPGHTAAAQALLGGLRRQGRWAAAAQACDMLAARGARHSALLLEWGGALAALEEADRAAALLPDSTRIVQTRPSDDFGAAEFNAAFARELSDHPLTLDRFPSDQANRGSRRVHHLASGGRPELTRKLAAMIQAAVDDYVARLAPAPGFDPWAGAVPSCARLSCWGLIQRAGEYEDWHFHPGGWLSGVYYVQVPPGMGVDGAGCLEIGPPRHMPDADRELRLRIAPCDGLLVLMPSHYMHRTISFAGETERISFAFDVAPTRPVYDAAVAPDPARAGQVRWPMESLA